MFVYSKEVDIERVSSMYHMRGLEKLSAVQLANYIVRVSRSIKSYLLIIKFLKIQCSKDYNSPNMQEYIKGILYENRHSILLKQNS